MRLALGAGGHRRALRAGRGHRPAARRPAAAVPPPRSNSRRRSIRSRPDAGPGGAPGPLRPALRPARRRHPAPRSSTPTAPTPITVVVTVPAPAPKAAAVDADHHQDHPVRHGRAVTVAAQAGGVLRGGSGRTGGTASRPIEPVSYTTTRHGRAPGDPSRCGRHEPARRGRRQPSRRRPHRPLGGQAHPPHRDLRPRDAQRRPERSGRRGTRLAAALLAGMAASDASEGFADITLLDARLAAEGTGRRGRRIPPGEWQIVRRPPRRRRDPPRPRACASTWRASARAGSPTAPWPCWRVARRRGRRRRRPGRPLRAG